MCACAHSHKFARGMWSHYHLHILHVFFRENSLDGFTDCEGPLSYSWPEGGHHSYTFNCTIWFYLTSLNWGNERSQYIKKKGEKHSCNRIVDSTHRRHCCPHCEMTNLSPKIQKRTQTNTTHRQTPKAITYWMTDNLSTCVGLICLGIKTGRQLRNLRRQSIPQTICFQHMYEPNGYLQCAVSKECMNKFMWVFWTEWGVESTCMPSMHKFELFTHRWESSFKCHLPLIQLQVKKK